MNSRLTIAVLLILIALVGVVAYVSRQPRPPTHATKHNDVFSPHLGTLKSFSYKPANGPLLAFEHVGSHWWIVSPMKVRGRDYAIGDLARTLADLKWRYRIRIAATGSHSLSRTGLEKPHGVLTLLDKAGKKFTLNIGTRNATGRLYVHVANTHNSYVDVVKADWLTRLKRPVEKFRNRSLASFHTRNIAAITLHTDKGIIRLVPNGKGWRMTRPWPVPAADAAVTSWISNLQLLTAHSFSDLSANRAGLKNGPLSITVDFKAPHPLLAVAKKNKAMPAHAVPAPTPLVVQFGIKTDLTGKFLYAQSSYNPGIAVVRNTAFSQLNESFSKLRSKTVVDLTGVKLQRIAIRRGARTVVLSREENKWITGKNGPANAKLVNDLLSAWKPLKAQKWFINARPVSLVPPITVDVTLRRPVKPMAAVAKAKPAVKSQFVPEHDVLTLWRMSISRLAATTTPAKAHKTTQTAATSQWRAELRKSGAAPSNPVWSFQPQKSLVAAVRALLKK